MGSFDAKLLASASSFSPFASAIGRGYNGGMAFPEWRQNRNSGQRGEGADDASFFARRRQDAGRGSAQARLDWRFEEAADWPEDDSPYRPKPDLAAETAASAVVDATPPVDYSLLDAFRGPQAAPRVAAVQRSLDQALGDWWREGRLPDLPVLRNGLLLLEAGYDLDESQRSLLLRAAIYRQRGLLTALSHQTDPERIGLLLAEALMDPASSLTPQQVRRLAREDDGQVWLSQTRRELFAVAAGGSTADQERARRLLAELDGRSLTAASASLDGGLLADEIFSPPRRSAWTRVGLAALAAALLIGALLGSQVRARSRHVIPVPGGAYMVTGQDGAPQQVILDEYYMDRTEVTVRDYRRCFAAGDCSWPASVASATRPDYLEKPEFTTYPMINVDLAGAMAYCAWAGARLPTAAEWEVAAGYAPATERAYVYPWGDRFEPRYANSALTEPYDTQPTGHYHPFGDSPMGANDMAGNVAEWTATVAADEPGAQVVKGGSFRDGADGLRVGAVQNAPASTAAPWLGFRCAMSRR